MLEARISKGQSAIAGKHDQRQLATSRYEKLVEGSQSLHT
ncbi:hypothetical protein DFR28_102183 [Arenicella xantha]|uniref:Uncharacterized protein n=1 Tax=Arenicella xantha TaxID=644221 RepID=A0A395JPY6_9GAMM|nr:hypothetical protein DFR28_102183 [Arenicella xantha]